MTNNNQIVSKLFSIILVTFFLMSFTTKPEPNNKFAQFHIVDAASREEYTAIEHFLRTQEGVLKVEVDAPTGVVYCLFPNDAHIDQTSFVHWLSKMNHTISCYREGVDGIDTIWDKEKFHCK